ncbi:hypothetical protein AAE478_001396 [Parahypoxylon ruwenzoriense]
MSGLNFAIPTPIDVKTSRWELVDSIELVASPVQSLTFIHSRSLKHRGSRLGLTKDVRDGPAAEADEQGASLASGRFSGVVEEGMTAGVLSWLFLAAAVCPSYSRRSVVLHFPGARIKGAQGKGVREI